MSLCSHSGTFRRRLPCFTARSTLGGAWVALVFATSPAGAADTAESESPEGAPIDVTVHGTPAPKNPIDSRASSRVDREELEIRLPRSAPDALRYEPGVFVQQTAHSQGSAFVRGRTGQQTVLLFDGVRVNTSTFRQGPNQYFFTVDSQVLHHIDVLRGGASTRWGSDAIGGAIMAYPLEPKLDLERSTPLIRPKTMVRYGSADHSFGERFQLDSQVSQNLRVLVGAGYRRVGNLRSGGQVLSPTTGQPPLVPRFEDDGTTQRGTSFWEATADARIVYQVNPSTRVTTAIYAYRQFDAPRTDQCPAPYAPRNECLNYDEQFRTLAYASLASSLGPWADSAKVTVSYQNQHERRTYERPMSFAENTGRDEVHTLGLAAHAETKPWRPMPTVVSKLSYGGDVYRDDIESKAWLTFTDLNMVLPRTRGQYLEGSRYLHGGLFAEPSVELDKNWVLRTGVRAAAVSAYAPGDDESSTRSVDRTWSAFVGHAGLTWKTQPWLSFTSNIDRSFRAPNLDDLTSRQQAGPGFQFENPELRPETSLSFEFGTEVSTDLLQVQAWAFQSNLSDAIVRATRSSADCPASTPQCQASWTRYQLVNTDHPAVIRGLELSTTLHLGTAWLVTGTFAATRGDMPNPQGQPLAPGASYEPSVPLSRIPPVNGTAEVRWKSQAGAYAGAAMRWALLQDRLAPSDLSDERIPQGGTPGFSVFDLVAGYRMARTLVTSVVFENVLDTAYRYHGSSVNGPGRGVIVQLSVGR